MRIERQQAKELARAGARHANDPRGRALVQRGATGRLDLRAQRVVGLERGQVQLRAQLVEQLAPIDALATNRTQ